ncbi:MAG: allantoinase [Acidobacteria bacterium]|nr:allantoinase [Acidobacteriota bacterium]
MLVVRSRRVVLPDGERAAALYIDRGVIDRIVEFAGDDPTGAKVFNVPDLVISPGLVDTHVHINEPGRTDWEGFDTATRAAAAGGVTTVIDMPLNSIPATTTRSALRAKKEAARAQCHVDVGFWGGVVPGNSAELDALVDAGVRGFKCFLVPSGVDEFPAVTEADLRQALPILARRNVPLLVHAEIIIAECGSRNADSHPDSNPQSAIHNPHYASYLATRPASMEVEAIRLMIRLAEEFDTRVHIVHVSSAEGVAAIAGAKAAGVPITAETCPHYLTFAAGEIGDEATAFKCAPPIREASHRAALWDGLASGALDLIATDHSPAPPALKADGDFSRAWGGIASLELSLPATYTSLKAQLSSVSSDTSHWSVAPSEASLRSLLARWMSAAPAALAGLERKGRLAEGFDADLVVWDPDADFVVDPAHLHQKHKLTPYAGRSLFGTVLTTFVRGERVWDNNRLTRAYGGQML